NRVVEARAVVRLRTLNRAPQFCAIGGEFTEDLDAVVEGDHHYFIVRTKLIDETDRCVLNVFESKLSGRACVEHQDYRERFVDRLKESDFLFDSVFPNAKLFFLKIWHVAAI